MTHLPVSAPKGHPWAGTMVQVIARQEAMIATTIGTSTLQLGTWRLCTDTQVTINPDNPDWVVENCEVT